MDYQTISNLLDKNILLMLTDLHKNNIITSFSKKSHLGYTYYFEHSLAHDFSGTIPYINLNYKDTIQFRTYWNYEHIYNFEDMKTEEDIIAIVEILKKSLFEEIDERYLQNISMMMSDLSREIEWIFYYSKQVKKTDKNIYEESKKLIEVINKTILLNNHEFNNKVFDDSSANKKKDKNTFIIKTSIKNNSEDEILLTNTTKKVTVNGRIGQHLFRKKLLQMYDKCAICGLDVEKLLKASHIKRWEFSNNKEKLDRYNGLLLCSCHDDLFDKGYITFTDEGNIIISRLLDEKTYNLLNIHHNINININIKEETKKYLKWHREEWFLDNNKRTT